MMAEQITVQQSVSLAVQSPNQGNTLLAKTLARQLNQEKWFDARMKRRFCALFLSNCIDQHIEKRIDTAIMAKVKQMPLHRGLRMLKRNSAEGIRILVAIVSEELRHKQKMTSEELCAFFEEIVNSFFPAGEDADKKKELVHFEVISKKGRKPRLTSK